MTNTTEKYIGELITEGKSDKTVVAYRTVLNQFLKWFEESNGHDVITKVTPGDIKDFKQYMVINLNRKPATINKALVILKGFFEWTVENGITKINSARKIKLVEKQKLAPRWLERNEQLKLLRTIEEVNNDFKKARGLAIVQIMMQAGLRVEEVSKLKLKDIEVNGRSGKVVVRHGICLWKNHKEYKIVSKSKILTD